MISTSDVAFTPKGYSLQEWQNAAVRAWIAGDSDGAFRGTLEIFTGGGKTLIALACAAKAAEICPDLSMAVVVPTEALSVQWFSSILKWTNLTSEEVGLLGAGGDDSFANKRCLVCVLNTASRRLPQLVQNRDEMMLIIDECHRAGAPTFSKVLETLAKFRLGLSATPDREELDEDGLPIEFDEQWIGKSLGNVVFRFSLRNAREIGWLPDYEIHHHGVELSRDEQQRYDEESRRIDDLADRLGDIGIEPGRARLASSRNDEVGSIAKAYVAATGNRKGLLYKAAERGRVTLAIIQDVLRRKSDARVLLFHERVDEAIELHSQFIRTLPNVRVALEHSRLPANDRRIAIADFKSGKASILVSVKSLVEGIDVPEADVGVSVAASSSVRQRIQSLGRVLRRSFDEQAPKKQAEMHLLFIAKTVDEAIYGKEDWADLTGAGANHYWHWPLEQTASPQPELGPPQKPIPTEEQEWDRLKDTSLELPQPWFGAVPLSGYSVDVLGNVTTPFGRIIANSQGVDRMMTAVRGKPGGRFYVTPMYRFIIIRKSDGTKYVGGRLAEPFVVRDDSINKNASAGQLDVLKPGDGFPGQLDKANGSYYLRQKQGGVIERRNNSDGSAEYALVNGSGNPQLEENARNILRTWRQVAVQGLQFHLNSQWHAWYLMGGEAKYLGKAVGGFAWPSSHNKENDGVIL